MLDSLPPMKRSNSMTEIQAFAKKAFPKKPRTKKS
jgi:hypothetical protein